MKKVQITQKEFEKWLNKQEDSKIFETGEHEGKPNEKTGCFLFQFAVDKYPEADHISCGIDVVTVATSKYIFLNLENIFVDKCIYKFLGAGTITYGMLKEVYERFSKG